MGTQAPERQNLAHFLADGRCNHAESVDFCRLIHPGDDDSAALKKSFDKSQHTYTRGISK